MRGIYKKDTVNGYVPDNDITYPPWASTAEQWWKPAAEREKWAILGEFIYLNNKQSDNLAEDAENIMDFEQIFFNHYKIMLNQSGVFRVKKKVRKIINKALKIN